LLTSVSFWEFNFSGEQKFQQNLFLQFGVRARCDIVFGMFFSAFMVTVMVVWLHFESARRADWLRAKVALSEWGALCGRLCDIGRMINRCVVMFEASWVASTCARLEEIWQVGRQCRGACQCLIVATALAWQRVQRVWTSIGLPRA
jgi:hypothetical protein